MYGKSKVLQDALAKLCGSFFLVTRAMQVLFVLPFYRPDKMDNIDRLIHDSGLKMAVKISCFVKELMYVLDLFRVTARNIHSFQIRSKEMPRIMYPKNPPPLWIIWINDLFLDFSKETKYAFSD